MDWGSYPYDAGEFFLAWHVAGVSAALRRCRFREGLLSYYQLRTNLQKN